MTASPEDAIAAVIDAGHRAAARGWVPATSGNFSARVDAARMAVSATGADKGALTRDDVLVLDIAYPRHERASAEAPLHAQLYRDRPETGAVWHVHSENAVLVSLRHGGAGAVPLAGLELLKAFRGITTHEAEIRVPILPNDQDTPRLAAQASRHILEDARLWGYLIAGHGLYAWGTTPAEAWRHLEAFDALFSLHLRSTGGHK
jgi:methylthioribulose-1-phosphate dehydratase